MLVSNVKPPIIPLGTLRDQIAQTVAAAKAYDLQDVRVRLGIQQAVESDDGQEAFGSKRQYVWCRILSWEEPALLDLAARVLREYPSDDLADTLASVSVRRDKLASKRLPTAVS
ncbi:hypothetical protein BG19_2206 [Burkholderia pseudomallei MSHR840]|nr:hypothetical protein BG19_2206 [Burkholderia pseudomallei MSHR840]